MAASKEIYRITAQSIPDLVYQLNFILSRFQDRLDQIEGVRGTSTIQDGLTIEVSNQIIHGFNTDNEV